MESSCHPERKHYAKGLCRSCYNKTPAEKARRKAYKLKWISENHDRHKRYHRRKQIEWRLTHKEYRTSFWHFDALDDISSSAILANNLTPLDILIMKERYENTTD